jgi:hypothetical protein
MNYCLFFFLWGDLLISSIRQIDKLVAAESESIGPRTVRFENSPVIRVP